MAGQSSAIIGLSWTDVSVLGSQVFGQAWMDSCGPHRENCVIYTILPMLGPYYKGPKFKCQPTSGTG